MKFSAAIKKAEKELDARKWQNERGDIAHFDTGTHRLEIIKCDIDTVSFFATYPINASGARTSHSPDYHTSMKSALKAIKRDA